MLPALRGHFGTARSIRLSVPRRSCLGYRHAVCLQLSHRRSPEMCGLLTQPWTDVSAAIFATVELPSVGAYPRGEKQSKKLLCKNFSMLMC